MKSHSRLKFLGFVVTLLSSEASRGGEPFFLTTLTPSQLENPKALCRNFTTPLGKEICAETNYSKQTELVRQLISASVGDGEEQAGHHFDLGAAYFFGMGVKKDNETATHHFSKSSSLASEPLSDAGSANYYWILYGPARK